MKHYVREVGFVLLLLILQTSTFLNVYANSGFTIESTNLQIYRDGLVNIKQILNIEDFYPKITVILLSSSIENLIVIDQNQKVVDYELNNFNLTIFTLGATQISINYDTIALTNKEAEVWSTNFENQYEILVCLPKNSTVIYLNEMPNAIDTQDNIITFTLQPNQWEISYLLSLSSIDETPSDQTSQNMIPVEYFIIALGIIIITIIFLFYFKKNRKPNIKKIFRDYPQLSKEDKAVIHFLAKNDGQAFEAEIRETFPDMPRTSLWRLTRRLERLEIVEIKKIGLENQVKLK